MSNIDSAILMFHDEWQNGDREKAKRIAKDYVQRHKGELQRLYGDCTITDMVAVVERFRASGAVVDRIIADMWLLSEYESQLISTDTEASLAIEEVEALLKHGT